MSQASRILSLDPRIRRVGFGCFDGLLLTDSGIRFLSEKLSKPEVKKLAITRILELLDRDSPQAVILPRIGADGVRRSRHVSDVIRAVTKEAARRKVQVFTVSTQEIKDALRDSAGNRPVDKVAISKIVAEHYRELSPRVVRSRRAYDPERHNVPLIDAVAMFLALKRADRQRSETEGSQT